MSRFEEGYNRFCSGTGVSQELRSLLKDVYGSIHWSSPDLKVIKRALLDLLSFLSQPEHRTDENCGAVDLFFCINDHWDVRWGNLPEGYRHLLDDIGGALHDTISAPEIAQSLESTPEQLLARAQRLPT
ncbi:MAG: hypothetical protein PVJ11_05470 [Syntrophobacterales bacterium]